MSRIFIHGYGAVSPAGWGMGPLREALASAVPIPTKAIARPGWEKPLTIRQVPPPPTRPAFLAHARLRRTSPVSQYVVAAALEAIGADAPEITNGRLRLGVVLCAMSGCVNYSRRFYDETLRDPATASPLVFPETVFNAPASHLAALLGTTAKNYTLVGDPGTFLQGIALAANWLVEKHVDACLVIGGEECDWLTSDAFHLFSRPIILGDGAGALYLKADATAGALAELRCVTDSHLFTRRQSRVQAAQKARAELPPCAGDQFLCDGLQQLPRLDAAEAAAWRDWSGARISPKVLLGEGLMAAAAWQCVVAIDALKQNRHTAASVSVVGCNQQAIGAHFANMKTTI
ncbi:MAG TPA: beta-ketoacyl synthase N-terminal-like domain-containing protein [Verrucomicrobiae bacterium]|nr:beta-ketoacyl synthase N-terminal-like domain-containing protein [Verrucomicrobiae bacterium]